MTIAAMSQWRRVEYQKNPSASLLRIIREQEGDGFKYRDGTPVNIASESPCILRWRRTPVVTNWSLTFPRQIQLANCPACHPAQRSSLPVQMILALNQGFVNTANLADSLSLHSKTNIDSAPEPESFGSGNALEFKHQQ